MVHITNSDNPDISHIESIVDIIKNFADGLHHAKEENIFFPFLAERGFSITQGPVAVMLHEHVQGRNFVKGLSENIAIYKNGNRSVLGEIYRNMNGYADLLRSHISKENNILFRMADNVLSESDHQDLLSRFTETEKNPFSTLNPQDYTSQIQELASFYKI